MKIAEMPYGQLLTLVIRLVWINLLSHLPQNPSSLPNSKIPKKLWVDLVSHQKIR